MLDIDAAKIIDFHRYMLADQGRTESYQKAIVRRFAGGCCGGYWDPHGHPCLFRMSSRRTKGLCYREGACDRAGKASLCPEWLSGSCRFSE